MQSHGLPPMQVGSLPKKEVAVRVGVSGTPLVVQPERVLVSGLKGRQWRTQLLMGALPVGVPQHKTFYVFNTGSLGEACVQEACILKGGIHRSDPAALEQLHLSSQELQQADIHAHARVIRAGQSSRETWHLLLCRAMYCMQQPSRLALTVHPRQRHELETGQHLLPVVCVCEVFYHILQEQNISYPPRSCAHAADMHLEWAFLRYQDDSDCVRPEAKIFNVALEPCVIHPPPITDKERAAAQAAMEAIDAEVAAELAAFEAAAAEAAAMAEAVAAAARKKSKATAPKPAAPEPKGGPARGGGSAKKGGKDGGKTARAGSAQHRPSSGNTERSDTVEEGPEKVGCEVVMMACGLKGKRGEQTWLASVALIAWLIGRSPCYLPGILLQLTACT
eukprot:102039-Pelagomonas_calceolata.AAC.4